MDQIDNQELNNDQSQGGQQETVTDFSPTEHKDVEHQNKVPAKDRISQLVGKNYELKNENSQLMGQMNTFKSENDQLKNQLESMNSQISQLTSTFNNQRKSEIQSQMQKALDDGDTFTFTKLQSDLLELNKPQPPVYNQFNQNQPQQQQNQQQSQNQFQQYQQNNQYTQGSQTSQNYTPEDIAFVARNSDWYNVDVAMTSTANEYAKRIVSEPEWANATKQQQLNEIERRVKADFVHKFNNSQINTGMGGITTPINQSKQEIVISQEEIDEVRNLIGKGCRKTDDEIREQLIKGKKSGRY